jgi:hypothetical protein
MEKENENEKTRRTMYTYLFFEGCVHVFLITQYMFTTLKHTHPYEYIYTNPTPMSTSEGLSTGRSGDSRSHHWSLVVDENVAYHLTHNVGKSQNKSRKRCEHQDLNPSR